MNIQNLIETLQEIAQENPDAEVRIAHQPSWPFEYSVGDIVACDSEGADPEELEHAREAAADGCETAAQYLADAKSRDTSNTVYIGEGSQLGYLPGVAARALSW